MFYKSDLGKYFIRGGEIYMCIAYTDKPTVILKNINSEKQESIVCDSMVAEEYNKLLEVAVDNKQYNIDKAKPVKQINTTRKTK